MKRERANRTPGTLLRLPPSRMEIVTICLICLSSSRGYYNAASNQSAALFDIRNTFNELDRFELNEI